MLYDSTYVNKCFYGLAVGCMIAYTLPVIHASMRSFATGSRQDQGDLAHLIGCIVSTMPFAGLP